ncbi:Hyaluronan synthase [compost metagenome]
MSQLLTLHFSAAKPAVSANRPDGGVVLSAVVQTPMAAGWYSVTFKGLESRDELVAVQLTAGGNAVVFPVAFGETGGQTFAVRLATPVMEFTLSGLEGEAQVELEMQAIGKIQALGVILARLAAAGPGCALKAAYIASAAAVSGGGVAAVGACMEASYKSELMRLARPEVRPLTLGIQRSWMSLGTVGYPLIASAGLRRGLEAGTWESTSTDPWFLLSKESLGHRLSGGWYRVRARMEGIDGKVIGPSLYPDYGKGGDESTMISLGEPGQAGDVDVMVVLSHDTLALRFDPTITQAGFRITRLELARLSRPGALLYMLRRVRNADGDFGWGVRGKALIEFCRNLGKQGLAAATRELMARYSDGNIRALAGYAHWAERYDNIGDEEHKAWQKKLDQLPSRPLISIVVPVYQTPERWLRRCIDSVLEQVYPEWELCIANDASPSAHVRQVLDEYAARDARIKVVHRPVNGHISAASNSALDVCSGTFIGLLDHDDELRPHALLEMAAAIAADPHIRMLYSDEDKVDETGRRFHPNFKPDWDPELLRAQNYICHFSVIDADLVREVGGFRLGYEGSQDHDLLLRCSEQLRPAQIRHIPQVLYHWRAIAGSTALARDAKDYASVAGARAVSDHLERIAAPARVEELPHGHFRIRWQLGAQAPKVSLIVPTRDRVELLRMCVESVLEKTDYPDYEIVVVDNQSSDQETLAYFDSLASKQNVRVLRYDAPFNYSEINNWAASQCTGDVICLLNNDIEVISGDWLQEMVSLAIRPEVGAVGAMLYYPDDTIQHAGVILGMYGVAGHIYGGMPRGYPGHGARALVAQTLSAVTAACLVVRREVYQEVGGLDPQLKVAFNDIDFCLRVRAAGYRNLWTPFAELYHHESASRGKEDTEEKLARFRDEVDFMKNRWGDALLNDPAYNPNLSLISLGAELAMPPRHG